jgi:hypothetical protein
MPYDWLTNEEVDDDELDYRNQLRDAVASGELKATPREDGGLDFGESPAETPSRKIAAPRK